MKPSVVSFLITLLLAAAVCIQGQSPVKDTDNKPVQVGKQYLILPVNINNNDGDGLIPFPVKIDPLCPLGISLGLFPNNSGLPISFAFPDSSPETIVKTFFDVTIEFQSEFWPVCKEFSKFWVVNETSSEPDILIGGNPRKENSWFQIRDDGEGAGRNTYELTTLTGTVGAIPGPLLNASKLVLTNDTAKTLLVKFKKVATTATTSTSQVEKFGLRMFPFY